MRILLQANTWTYGLFSGLWRALRYRGHEVFCDFALPSHEAYFRRQNGAPAERSIAGTCRSWVAQHLRAPAPGEIARLERRLSLRLPQAWATDIFHIKFGVLPRRSAALQQEFFERYFVTAAEYYDRVLDAIRPEVVLFEGPNGLTDNVLFAAATVRGIPALNLAVGLTVRKFGLSYGSGYRNLLFEKLFLDDGALPPEAVVMAREYIGSLRTLAVKEAYYNRYVGRRASWSFGSGVHFMAKLARAAGRATRPISPEEQCRCHLMWMTDNARRPFYSIERRRNERYVLRHAGEPLPDEDFAAFYLHFQPEAVTSVQAPYFINQNSLCEALAISLPGDMALYVKEHKASLGDRGPAYYRDLFLYPNVRLISPFVPGVELARQARFVATLTGTVGFEAIALNKPVLIFGDTFYDICPWIHKVKNLEDLASLVPRLCALEAGNTGPEAEAEIERFFASYFASLRDGDCGAFTAEQIEAVGLDQANVDRIAASLEDLLASWLELLPTAGNKADGNLELARHFLRH
jgi:Capsule polysaccharide biosynthesis protein